MALLVDIEKQLGSFHLKVRLETGQPVLALLGASGCGKTMTLKCIAGIEKPDRGRIVLDGMTLFDSERGINLPPQQRRVGYLFQQYALFPNMTVAQNITAGLRGKKDDGIVDRMLQMMHLEDAGRKRPRQLSGGEQQRVALARILVSEPEILLLDEPFSALDGYLRFQLEQQVRSVIQQFGKTVVLVSHDRDEVYRLADEIAVMAAGRVETFGPKKQVFACPQTRHGALLTGCKNISKAQPAGPGRVRALDWGLELAVREVAAGTDFVGIRMHDLRLDGTENRVRCQVTEVVENPFSVVVMLRPDGAAEPLGWETDKETWRRVQADALEISLPPESILLLTE